MNTSSLKKQSRKLRAVLGRIFHEPDIDWLLVWVFTLTLGVGIVSMTLIRDARMSIDSASHSATTTSITLDIVTLDKVLETYKTKSDIFQDILDNGLAIPEPGR